MMSQFIQSIVDALSAGATLGLAALAIGLVFGVIRLANFAQAEIEQMKSWIDGDDSDSHAGHGMSMDGMLTESEIETLRNSTGATFDRLFIEEMIGHHEGAISMVEIIDGSKNSEVKELAASIVSSQSAEITAMKELLTRLP